MFEGGSCDELSFLCMFFSSASSHSSVECLMLIGLVHWLRLGPRWTGPSQPTAGAFLLQPSGESWCCRFAIHSFHTSDVFG